MSLERNFEETPRTFVGAIGAIGEINFVIVEAVVEPVVVEVKETARQRADRIWGMESKEG